MFDAEPITERSDRSPGSTAAGDGAATGLLDRDRHLTPLNERLTPPRLQGPDPALADDDTSISGRRQQPWWRVAAFGAAALVGGAVAFTGAQRITATPEVVSPAVTEIGSRGDFASPPDERSESRPDRVDRPEQQEADPAGEPADSTSGVDPVVAVAAALGPSVVQVETDAGQGSGVVFDSNHIMTNHHVIAGTSQVRVRMVDGRSLDVDVVGSDPRVDIAVLRVVGDHSLQPAEIADVSELVVGQLVVAIGSPFLLDQTVTAGIISALDRPVTNDVGGLSALIQTDAAINPGNSGGALADRQGRVVGINSSGQTDGVGNSNIGLGFAIPIDRALNVSERIMNGQPLDGAVLGISSDPSAAPEITGVAVGSVTPDSAAEASGIAVGDRILALDDRPVTSVEQLSAVVQGHFPGEQVEVVVLRDGVEAVVEVLLR